MYININKTKTLCSSSWLIFACTDIHRHTHKCSVHTHTHTRCKREERKKKVGGGLADRRKRKSNINKADKTPNNTQININKFCMSVADATEREWVCTNTKQLTNSTWGKKSSWLTQILHTTDAETIKHFVSRPWII